MAIFNPADFFGEWPGRDAKININLDPVPCTFVHPADSAVVYKLIMPSSKGPWIAGGACLSWYNNRACASDIDVYFRNQKQYDASLDWIIKNHQIYNRIDSTNAVTLTLQAGTLFNIQLIKKDFYQSAEDIINDFDISVCQIVWDGEKLIVGNNFVNDAAKKVLRFINFNPNSHKRLLKYICYGYEPAADTIEKLIHSPIIDWQLMGSDHYA